MNKPPPPRDNIIVIAAVAWWRADPADLRGNRPPNAYDFYAIDFADAYKAGDRILDCVRLINRNLELHDETNRMIAELIHFGFYQFDYLAPDAEELDARNHVTDEL